MFRPKIFVKNPLPNPLLKSVSCVPPLWRFLAVFRFPVVRFGPNLEEINLTPPRTFLSTPETPFTPRKLPKYQKTKARKSQKSTEMCLSVICFNLLNPVFHLNPCIFHCPATKSDCPATKSDCPATKPIFGFVHYIP